MEIDNASSGAGLALDAVTGAVPGNGVKRMKLYFIELDSDNPDDFTATKVTKTDVESLVQAIGLKIVSTVDDLTNERLSNLEEQLRKCL